MASLIGLLPCVVQGLEVSLRCILQDCVVQCQISYQFLLTGRSPSQAASAASFARCGSRRIPDASGSRCGPRSSVPWPLRESTGLERAGLQPASASMSSLATSVWPLYDACISSVSPSLSPALTSAPARRHEQQRCGSVLEICRSYPECLEIGAEY